MGVVDNSGAGTKEVYMEKGWEGGQKRGKKAVVVVGVQQIRSGTGNPG